METTYRRAPHICLSWEANRLFCTSGITGRVFRISPDLVRLLDEAGAGTTKEKIALRAGLPVSLVQQLIDSDLLVSVDPDEGCTGEDVVWWNTYELVLQRMMGRGRKRTGYLEMPMPPQRRYYKGSTVQLPTEKSSRSGPSFAEVLAFRRSRRSFSDRPLALSELAQLLLGAAQVTSVDEERGVSYRPYPSGGGRHSLEVYVVAARVEGLTGGVYHFDPVERHLVSLPGAGAVGAALRDGALIMADDPTTENTSPAAILLITSYFARTLWKYENAGLTIIYKDVGCLTQTFYLQAAALGLAGYAVAGGPERAIAMGLGLDPTRGGVRGSVFCRPRGRGRHLKGRDGEPSVGPPERDRRATTRRDELHRVELRGAGRTAREAGRL
jgi:SagB-type dehydrogenase domain